jgi:stage II sporulation protein D
MFGFNKIKSLLFEMTLTSDGKYHIAGHGYGHGSGLCQWGTKYLAEQGEDYLTILHHYYPKATITPLSEVLNVAHR